MPFEPVLLCRDVDLVENEWILIQVSTRFEPGISSLYLFASVSGQARGSFIPFTVDLFRLTESGGENLLSEPHRFELEVKSTWPECLMVHIAIPEPLYAGTHYAILTLLDESKVVPFRVEAPNAA